VSFFFSFCPPRPNFLPLEFCAWHRRVRDWRLLLPPPSIGEEGKREREREKETERERERERTRERERERERVHRAGPAASDWKLALKWIGEIEKREEVEFQRKPNSVPAIENSMNMCDAFVLPGKSDSRHKLRKREDWTVRRIFLSPLLDHMMPKYIIVI
jgi:hypothetical protein